MQCIAVLVPAQQGGFVALKPETGTITQGESIEEALANSWQVNFRSLMTASQRPCSGLGPMPMGQPNDRTTPCAQVLIHVFYTLRLIRLWMQCQSKARSSSGAPPEY